MPRSGSRLCPPSELVHFAPGVRNLKRLRGQANDTMNPQGEFEASFTAPERRHQERPSLKQRKPGPVSLEQASGWLCTTALVDRAGSGPKLYWTVVESFCVLISIHFVVHWRLRVCHPHMQQEHFDPCEGCTGAPNKPPCVECLLARHMWRLCYSTSLRHPCPILTTQHAGFWPFVAVRHDCLRV